MDRSSAARVESERMLAHKLSEYRKNAAHLEMARQNNALRIERYVEDHVIPEVSSYLPEGYSISEEDSEVVSSRDEGDDSESVPRSFSVYLRLHYHGEPITPMSPGEEGIEKIQWILKNRLNDIARRCRLEEIVPIGEPME